MRLLWFLPVVLVAAVSAVMVDAPGREGTALGVPALAVDADPAGNTATSLGTVEDCVSVDPGATFGVDIVVTNVENLLAWEAYFVYDPGILEVLAADVRLFTAANPNSNVANASDPTPDTDGLFFVGAVDGNAALDSGSGVLARLTLRAVGSGISAVALPKLDFNDDGVPDQGPVLGAVEFGTAVYLGDVDGDELFDGTVGQAEVAVGQPCPVAEQDLDGDGFSDTGEAVHLGTDPARGCAASGGPNDELPPDAWPPDADDDRDADIGDVVALFRASLGNPSGYAARSDANGDADNDIGDVIGLFGAGRMGTGCG